MLDHVSVRVSDIGRALDFYKPALAAIGYEVIMEFPEAVGLGQGGKPDLWIMKSDQPVNPGHVALIATRPQVDAFHAAAVAAGGMDNGGPGLRPDYHQNYYASFARDPDGNNIEAVCQEDPNAVPKVAARSASAARARPKAKTKPKAKARKPAKSKKAAKSVVKKSAAKKSAKKPPKKLPKKPPKNRR